MNKVSRSAEKELESGPFKLMYFKENESFTLGLVIHKAKESFGYFQADNQLI